MKPPAKTSDELAELRARLTEAQETLDAIRTGKVDAIVGYGTEGEKVFTLQGADYPYRVFVEAMSEGAATISADFTILYCNRRFAEMVGAPPEEIIGMPIENFVSEDDRPVLDVLLKSGGLDSTRGELQLRPRTGNLLRVNFSLNPIQIEDSAVICLLATDLTGAEWSHQLVASERLARAILNQAADAIIVCDKQGQVMRASDYAQTLCGCNPMMQSFEKVFHIELTAPELAAAGRPATSVQMLYAVLNGESFRELEGRLTRANGEVCDVLLGARPLIVNGPIQGAVIVLSNVTPLKQSERRLAVLYDATNTLATARSLDDAAPGLVQAVCSNLNADRAEVWRWNPGMQRLQCVYDWDAPGVSAVPNRTTTKPSAGPAPAKLNGWFERRTQSTAPGDGIVGRIFEEPRAVFFADISAEPGLDAGDGVAGSAFGFPIQTGDRPAGVMVFFRTSHQPPEPELLEMLTALGRQIGQFVDRKAAEEQSRGQQAAIRALSTPVLKVRDRVLVLPLIGIIDPERARQLTGQLLDAIRVNRARVVVMDITGVAGIDDAVANHLVHTVKAARLLGARTILCGASRSIAGTLSSIEVDLSIIQTVADLQSGLEEAERSLGYELLRPPTGAAKLAAARAAAERAAEAANDDQDAATGEADDETGDDRDDRDDGRDERPPRGRMTN